MASDLGQDAHYGDWRPIAGAPRDGSHVLVAIRASEQGAAEVDVARWGRVERDGDDCWLSTDSDQACPIMYHESELAFWMPLPSSVPKFRMPDLAKHLPPVPSMPDEVGGSGI